MYIHTPSAIGDKHIKIVNPLMLDESGFLYALVNDAPWVPLFGRIRFSETTRYLPLPRRGKNWLTVGTFGYIVTSMLAQQ